VFKRPDATPGVIASALNVSEGEAERLLASIMRFDHGSAASQRKPDN